MATRRLVASREDVTLLVFASALLASSISITNVFPYAPTMVAYLGMTSDSREYGFYAGFLMTSYQLGMMLTSYHLGKYSDLYGRKRIMLVGLASCTLPQLIFGCSQNFYFAISVRFLMGLPNGVVAVAKAMAPELVPPRRQPLAMSLVAGMWGLGNIIGPSLGGLLAERGDGLLASFPYLMPNAVCALLSAAAMLAVHKRLPETTGRHRSTSLRSLSAADSAVEQHAVAVSADGNASDVASGSATSDGRSGPQRRRSFSLVPREAVPPLAGYAMVALTGIMFDELFPLWCAAPVASGGLGVEASTIGGLLTASGAALLIFQLLVLPIVAARVPLDRLFKVSCLLNAIVCSVFPLVALAEEPSRTLLLLLAIIMYRCANSGCFTCIFVLINNSVRASDRGRVQGLAMAGAAAMRAAGPLISSMLFAWSLTNELHTPFLDVHFVFLLCSLAAAGTGVFALRYLPAKYNVELHPSAQGGEMFAPTAHSSSSSTHDLHETALQDRSLDPAQRVADADGGQRGCHVSTHASAHQAVSGSAPATSQS